MHIIDAVIFIAYLIFMVGVGFYYLRKNKSKEDYFVGGRTMGAGHIGLSVVATDVGGGFSIGLGGLGFTLGISGSWMLFTGLIGAWISAVFLIPKVYPIAAKNNFLTFPQVLSYFYNKKVALLAAFISFIGYLGFTSSQILAGAKLATATFPTLSLTTMLIIMGAIAVGYTVIGGIKAVIYTDTIQWTILMVGLLFIGLPIGYYEIGGWEAIKESLPKSHLTFTNISWVQAINWVVTIVPIWFVGMTLYQRIFACKDEKTTQKAWFIAGLFEWPIMAFLGVVLGMFARVAFNSGMFQEYGYGPSVDFDPELGLPLLLNHILPVGLMGLMMSAYFSAIMSTADSCLMAASGNFTSDILGRLSQKWKWDEIALSQRVTFLIGAAAILLATYMTNVLELMLYSYAFMVSGLLVPVLATLILKRPSSWAAMVSMVSGGMTTLILIVTEYPLPQSLDANIFGISISLLSFIITQSIDQKTKLWLN